jgi:hypothetical protein
MYYVAILTIVMQNIKFLCVTVIGSLPNIPYSLLLDRHCMFLLSMVPEEIQK